MIKKMLSGLVPSYGSKPNIPEHTKKLFLPKTVHTVHSPLFIFYFSKICSE